MKWEEKNDKTISAEYEQEYDDGNSEIFFHENISFENTFLCHTELVSVLKDCLWEYLPSF